MQVQLFLWDPFQQIKIRNDCILSVLPRQWSKTEQHSEKESY